MRSILLVTAAPDDRPSTVTLRVIAEELQRRPDVRSEVWFLRAAPEDELWGSFRVVDELRTWKPAVWADHLGVPVLPDLVRGLRLKWWLRQLHPDVVVLDDGLGARLFDGRSWFAGHKPVMVSRVNYAPARHAEWEPAPLADPDVVLVDPGTNANVPEGARTMAAAHVREYPDARRLGTADVRAATRDVLGLPEGVPLVCGWGDDGWIDGPDLFVRVLWALEQRHGIVAHGLWLGLGADPDEVKRLYAEAERCGLAGRFHQRSGDTPAARSCGDVAFLPYRDPGDPFEVMAAVVSGLGVVTFTTAGVRDPMVVEVPPLDVDAAASALAKLLDTDRDEVAEAARSRLDVAGWVDSLLDLTGELR